MKMTSSFALVAIAALALTGCGSDDSSVGSDMPLSLSPLHAEPDPVEGGRIADDEGREVLLRGVNVNALVQYWQATDFPTTFPFTESDADGIAEIGWNVVRLLLSWSRVEPQPGTYDEAYLDEVEAAVDLLASRSIYSIVDLHQDAWGATLAARPDESCAPSSTPAFGWDGAPAWATLDGGAARCALGGQRELSPAVLASFAAFWDNAAGPGDVGLRTRYARMLGHVAERFAKKTSVAGYDVMNEPNAFTPAHQRALGELHSEALAQIRAGEQRARGYPHLVFFEPSALWSASGAGAPPDFERDRDVVYAPHIYTGGFTNGPITPVSFQTARDEAKKFGGAPVFSGEWGTDPRRALDPSDGYFVTHQSLQDQFRLSATLWTWRESCGDPHKAGDYRSGNVPFVWGELEVDCISNEVVGVRQELIDQLTRAYVRAAPGRLSRLSYDDDAGELVASGSSAEAGVELVAFYPSSRHGAPEVTTTGLVDVQQLSAPGGNTYIVARSSGGDWSVRVP